MKITVYAKKRKTGDGRSFVSYLSKLRKKDGEELTVSVKFKEGEVPGAFPVNLEVPKEGANLAHRKYQNKKGEDAISYTLWVNTWEPSPDVWRDDSLDDFED